MEYGKTIGERLVVSLFVNPAQFGPQEDLGRYPRDLDRDVRLARDAGVDCLYTPGAGAMYPPGYQTFVAVESLSDGLCGASRPGHFKGVATVVLKLLNQVSPRVAVFGEKDYQQLMVITRMAADLNLATEIVGRPIVREPDGLAMSSRNTYLSPEERDVGPVPLSGPAGGPGTGGLRGHEAGSIFWPRCASLLAPRPAPESTTLSLVDPVTLQEVEAIRGEARLLLAVWINKTRLIDNTLLSESRVMLRVMMKSKIHRATITQAELHYEGSLTISAELMRAADILPYEMVHVYNVSNGNRFETYAIEGEENSGVICLNGAAARQGAVGDLIIITTYATYEAAELERHHPKVVMVDRHNRLKNTASAEKPLAFFSMSS